MPKFKINTWWYELYGSTLEIEASSIEEAEKIADENLKQMVEESKKNGKTYLCDGAYGYDKIEKVAE